MPVICHFYSFWQQSYYNEQEKKTSRQTSRHIFEAFLSDGSTGVEMSFNGEFGNKFIILKLHYQPLNH